MNETYFFFLVVREKFCIWDIHDVILYAGIRWVHFKKILFWKS